MLIAIMGFLAFTLLNVMYKVTRTHVLGILLFDWLTGMGQLLVLPILIHRVIAMTAAVVPVAVVIK